MKNKITVGVMSQDEIRARMLAIVRGEYKPKASDPKIWFASMKLLTKVLSDENRALLKAIESTQPDSISKLAKLTARKQSTLSRTLKIMSNYGIVQLLRENRKVRPVVKATEFRILIA